MNVVGILLRQICIMLLFMAMGVFLYKKKLLTKNGSKELGSMLLYLILPCTIVKAYLSELTYEKLIGLGLSFVGALAALLLSMLVSHLVFKRKYRIENFGTAFSNAGFIGIPLVQAVLGSEAVFYISSFVALLNILQWTYGVLVMTDSKENIRPGKLLRNPILISMTLGILLFLLQVPVPEVVASTISQIASMNAPVAMVILGTYLAQVKMRELFTDKIAYVSCVVRLLVIPVLTFFLLSVIPKDYYDLKLTLLISASAPIGSNVAIFAQMYDQSYTQAVKGVCLSTIFSVLTLPLVIGVGSYFWM